MKNTFRTRTYEIHTKKIKQGTRVRFALLADQHGAFSDAENQELYSAILNGRPDAVLIAGDMIVSRNGSSLNRAAGFVSHLSEKIPVYYELGNHECKMRQTPELRGGYLRYERSLTEAGVCFLHNQCVGSTFAGNDFWFYGLEISLAYYRKPVSPALSLTDVEKQIGIPSRPGFHVLLAHNPKYGNTYFSWGADLIVSGHYHGGMLRLDEHHGLISPQFQIFPEFCCGDFHRGSRRMIVSAGLGEHTVPLRIHNPRELIFIDLIGKETGHGNSGKN